MNKLEEQLQRGPNLEVEANLLVAKSELDCWENRENSRTAQLAKKRWLNEGDQNTKFFHAIVNQRWNSLTIHSMRLEDGMI